MLVIHLWVKPYCRNTVFNLHSINKQLTLCLLTQAKLQQWVSSHYNAANTSWLVPRMRIPQSCQGAGQYSSYRLNTFSHAFPKNSKATWVIQQSPPLCSRPSPHSHIFRASHAECNTIQILSSIHLKICRSEHLSVSSSFGGFLKKGICFFYTGQASTGVGCCCCCWVLNHN